MGESPIKSTYFRAAPNPFKFKEEVGDCLRHYVANIQLTAGNPY